MAKKTISAKQLLPASVQSDKSNKLREITDLKEIMELMSQRTIVSADRFVLEPGDYEFDTAEACEWKNGNKMALMVVVTFKDGSQTTVGSLRKIDANMKNYGPAVLPVTEAEILEKIIESGLTVTKVVDTYVTRFEGGERIADANDISGSGYATKPAKLMAWEFGSASSKPAPAATGKKK